MRADAGIGLGRALRRALIAYRRRLHERLAAAGLPTGRQVLDEHLAASGLAAGRLADGQALRLCLRPEGATISELGRELGITRQGASKLVASLRDAGYVTVEPSPTSGREKRVRLTPVAVGYLAAREEAMRAVEEELRAELGPEALDTLFRLLDRLARAAPASGPRIPKSSRRPAGDA